MGLHWHCPTDTLSYKSRLVVLPQITMRTICKVLASQYDPVGFIVPYTTRAKVIVQQLWAKQHEWDDPNLPEQLLEVWRAWDSELPDLQHITLPCCYTSDKLDPGSSWREICVFCDASEKAYDSVAYFRTEDHRGSVDVAFVAARSRVGTRKQQSVPQLELCAALTGAQLANVLKAELTLCIHLVVRTL